MRYVVYRNELSRTIQRSEGLVGAQRVSPVRSLSLLRAWGHSKRVLPFLAEGTITGEALPRLLEEGYFAESNWDIFEIVLKTYGLEENGRLRYLCKVWGIRRCNDMLEDVYHAQMWFHHLKDSGMCMLHLSRIIIGCSHMEKTMQKNADTVLSLAESLGIVTDEQKVEVIRMVRAHYEKRLEIAASAWDNHLADLEYKWTRKYLKKEHDTK